MRVVLTDSYGRYGSLGFTTNSDGFAALGLREALSSVQSLVPVSEDSFRAALSGVSIYFDFLDPLPLSVLTEMIGVEDAALTGSARCLLLSAGADETVRLYLWDGADSVRSGTVSASVLSREALAETVSQSGYSGVSFAFDDVEADPPVQSALSPSRSWPTELPELPVLSAVFPPLRDGLAPAGPSASTSIPGSGMWRRTAPRWSPRRRQTAPLHIRPDGEVTYRGGTESPLVITRPGGAPHRGGGRSRDEPSAPAPHPGSDRRGRSVPPVRPAERRDHAAAVRLSHRTAYRSASPAGRRRRSPLRDLRHPG